MTFADFMHWLNGFLADACLFEQPNSNHLGIIRAKLDNVIPSDRETAAESAGLVLIRLPGEIASPPKRKVHLSWKGAEPILSEVAA